ncbi:MAG TPA: polyphosphate kinase 1 [Vicinamibacterales bacterium]|nr:polyphosphate kinase 1 [Vicinamibacterales bacterium]
MTRSLPTRVPEGQAQPQDAEAIDLRDPALYINRETSWLEFNARVLAQARDMSHPLLERVKFLAIVAKNLDEFFMIRIATTVKKLRAGIGDVTPDGLTTEQELLKMRDGGLRMLDEVAACWKELQVLLEHDGIHFLEIGQWTPQVRAHLAKQFSREICPLLTPLAFDPGHPFPIISNLSKNFAVVVKHRGRTKFARVKLPDAIPRFFTVPESIAPQKGVTVAFMEDVVRENMHELFPDTQVKGSYLFRVTRDADVIIDEDNPGDLLESVDKSVKQLRHSAVALLQVEAALPARVLNILVENFEIDDEEVVVRTSERMGVGDWMQLHAIQRPQLKDAPYSPRLLWRTEDPEVIFDQVRYQDQLVHHPFDAFSAVEDFLRAAVRDRHVLAIKMTLYRIGANSPLVDLLIEGAESGKQVSVLVELKARLDERANIVWAKRLEQAGVHVVYGFTDLKTHSKLCLVVRREPDGIQRYVHIGTGNYNAQTAKVYTDLGIFTADAEIVADASEIFNYLTGYSNQTSFRQLLVAPLQLRPRLVELIMREAEHAREGRPAHIIIKVNSVTDDQMIRVLYRASQAGVRIDFIVRGICSLRPGVPGVSDNIRVRSIIGRFLEHSRIYWFGNAGEDEAYIGSADLMERNLDRRVEALVPVRDADIRTHIREVVLNAYLRDTARATVLDSSGIYEHPAPSSGPSNAQDFLLGQYAVQGE